MRTSPSWAVALAATLALLPSTRGADEALKSGPQSGQLVPGPFHPYNVNGAHADRPHCLVCEFGLHPVVAVFARDLPEADKPLGRLLKRLDELVGQHRKEELRAFAVLLTEEAGDVDKRQALAAKLKELIKALELKNLIVSLDAPDGPPGYDLSKDADVTVLLYFKHQVLLNRAFGKDKLTDPAVETLVTELGKTVSAKAK